MTDRRELLGMCAGVFGVAAGCAALPSGRVPAGSLVVENEGELPREATVRITSERAGRTRFGSIPIRPGEERLFREVISTEGSYTFVVSDESGEEKRVPFEYPSREYVEVSFTGRPGMTVARVTVDT